MATGSYTTSLRLALPTTGDLFGTWGTEVNNSITQMVDQAVAGRAVVVMPADADYTLTALNGTSDEARCLALKITSGVSLTATRNVICPTVSKLWIVENATTGAQSIQVKTAAGTGVTIPNGKTYSVRCDGTNIVAATDVPSGSLTFLQSGTGSVLRTGTTKWRDLFSVKDFGALGDGSNDDQPAIQLCVTAALAAQKGIYFPSGTYKLGSTVTFNAWWGVYGDGNTSIIYVTDTTIPAFTFAINTTSVSYPYIDGVLFSGPLTTTTTSCAIRFTGDATALVQHGYFRFGCIGFNAAVKDEKTARVTGAGLEGMLNWNRWVIQVLNTGSAAFWGTQGSGTGNVWEINGLTANAGAAILKYEGVGCVVGDIIGRGNWGCQAAGGVGLEIGASTVYRAQIKIGDAQFDANLDVPIKLNSTGAVRYTNFNLSDNNIGGTALLGNAMQPLYNSVVLDRDYSEWQAGKSNTSSATVLTTTSCFDVAFATVGAASLRITAAGVVGGVGSCITVAEYDVREGGGSLTLTGPYNNRSSGGAGALAISVTVSGVTATVKISHTATAGSTAYNVSVSVTGDGFRVTRL